VGHKAGLDGRKISSPPGFDPGPSSLQSVAIPIELPGPQLRHSVLKNRIKCAKGKLWNHIVTANYINPLKTNTNLSSILRPSPYRAVNTLRLGYRNQSVNVV